MKKNTLKKRIVTSIVLILLIFLIFNSLYLMILSLIILGILSILEFLSLTRKIFKKKIFYIISNLAFIIFISIFSISFFILYNFNESKFILLVLLIGCVASDIGGFIVGKLFKGPKLITISPKKTISGSIGSFVLTCLATSGLIYFETNIINFFILVIGLMISLYCQAGDLFFSFLKRKAKLKDTGNFLPGHGGVLDRLDGIFFGIPLGFITIILFL
tara:strand:+ start:657 stop:1307 length:651 start_codon:yes stop_codon:yes gene_type:complete